VTVRGSRAAVQALLATLPPHAPGPATVAPPLEAA
jgi:hypothetical protein